MIGQAKGKDAKVSGRNVAPDVTRAVKRVSGTGNSGCAGFWSLGIEWTNSRLRNLLREQVLVLFFA